MRREKEEAEQQPRRASGAYVTDAPCVGVDISPGGAVVTFVSDVPRHADQQLEAQGCREAMKVPCAKRRFSCD